MQREPGPHAAGPAASRCPPAPARPCHHDPTAQVTPGDGQRQAGRGGAVAGAATLSASGMSDSTPKNAPASSPRSATGAGTPGRARTVPRGQQGRADPSHRTPTAATTGDERERRGVLADLFEHGDRPGGAESRQHRPSRAVAADGGARNPGGSARGGRRPGSADARHGQQAQGRQEQHRAEHGERDEAEEHPAPAGVLGQQCRRPPGRPGTAAPTPTRWPRTAAGAAASG